MARFSLLSLLVQVWTLSVLGLALPSGQISSRATDPSTDPFYQPPAGFESTKPGTILKQRQVIASFFGILPDPIQTYQLLYRTTAVNGSAIATVTTIFKPFNSHPDRFVSFQTAYDSSASQCKPSYNYQLGAPQQDLISSLEFLIIQAYLASGYTVSSPDYEGPDSAFSPGHLEGMGTLDSIRAVGNFNKTLGLTSSNPAVVGVGYSGGAIATGWAAALQSSYAPEVNAKGWVAGGTPANLTSTLLKIDNTLFSGFVPTAIDGLLKPSAYGAELQPLVDRIITPLGRSKLDFADQNCAPADLINFFHMSFLSTDIQSLGPALLEEPTVKKILADQILGVKTSERPVAPVLLYHAVPDEIIPYASAATLADNWCSQGASVHFTTYGNGGHVTTEVIGLPDALSFTNSAFAGTLPKGCSKDTKLDNLLNPIALGVALEPIATGLIEVLVDAGDQDANIISSLETLNKTVKR